MTVQQDDVLRVTAEMSIGADALQNVFHLRSTNAAGIGDAQALTDMALHLESWYGFIDQHMSTGVSFDQVRVQNVTQNTLLGTTGWPTLVAGLDATNKLPLPVAALVTLPTSKPNTRGGTYFGGFCEDRNDLDGKLDATIQASLASIAADMLLEQIFGVNSYRLVVYNAVLKTFVLPVAGLVADVWRTQRRRRQGVGI